jgi:hypothetical protein
MRPLAPHIRKKVKELRHTIKDRGNGRHVHVQGVMEIGKHTVPFSYYVHEDETTDHAAKIEKHHDDLMVWAGKVDDHDTLRGAEFGVQNAEVKVIQCSPSFGSMNHWHAYVEWAETRFGVTKNYSITKNSFDPANLPTSQELMSMVIADVMSRFKDEDGIEKHRKAIDALNRDA